MGRIVTVAVLLVVIVAGVVGGVPRVRAALFGVPLKMQFREGQETRIKQAIEGTLRLDVSGLPENVLPQSAAAMFNADVPFEVELRSRQVVKSVSDGVAEVESRGEGGSIKMRLPGGGEPIRYTVPESEAVRYKVGPEGRVEYTVTAAPQGGVRATDIEKMQNLFASLTSATVPGDRCRTGAAWSQDINLPVHSGGVKATVNGIVKSTFETVTSKLGHTVADIRRVHDIKVDLDATAAPAGSRIDGSIHGADDTYFDWIEGRNLATEGSLTFDLTLEMKRQAPQPLDAKAHLTGSVRLKSETL